MQQPRLTLTIALALALLASSAWLLTPDISPKPALVPAIGLAPSQTGTTADGQIDAAGDALQIDDDLRRRFDYYLAGLGERPLDVVLASIDADLRASLPPAAARDASRLLRRYIDYKRALASRTADLRGQGDDIAGLRARLDAQRRLRSQFFSAAESRGLFGWQDAYDDDALARFTVAHDARLTPSQVRQQLDELARHEAPEIVAARQAPVQYLSVDDAVKAARASGADAATVHRIRAESVGEAAADRLAVLDRETADWQQRINAYLADRRAILADPTLDTAAKAAAIQRLREARFDATAQLRLAAYE
jgi:lipase chaperone LimK